MLIFTTINDVISDIAPALGDFADDFDIEAIAREAYTYDASLGGFVQVLTDEEFWECVESHEQD